MDMENILSSMGVPVNAHNAKAFHWVLMDAGQLKARARLDIDPESGRIEFGIYEPDELPAVGRAAVVVGELSFEDDEQEAQFEHFLEAIRGMTLSQHAGHPSQGE